MRTGSGAGAPEDKRLFTDGNVRPGVEIRLGPDGEIFSRGPDLCLGYTDEALTPIVAGTQDHFVDVFADKIPKTHGAPVRPEPVREVVATE